VQEWPPQVERVASVLRAQGVESRLEEFADGTPTAAAAAAAVGCDAGQIVKSLVFICDGRPVLALLPGDRRADPVKVASAASARFARVASHDEVRSATGFEPGAVAPFPVADATKVLVERELLRQATVWAGAGSSNHMVGLSPLDIVRVTRAEVADLSEA
jgi:prolyl-tRNA editing enzyme YbaK/EbsC (Cys-tRNA(Pro) deacylase)